MIQDPTRDGRDGDSLDEAPDGEGTGGDPAAPFSAEGLGDEWRAYTRALAERAGEAGANPGDLRELTRAIHSVGQRLEVMCQHAVTHVSLRSAVRDVMPRAVSDEARSEVERYCETLEIPELRARLVETRQQLEAMGQVIQGLEQQCSSGDTEASRPTGEEERHGLDAVTSEERMTSDIEENRPLPENGHPSRPPASGSEEPPAEKSPPRLFEVDRTFHEAIVRDLPGSSVIETPSVPLLEDADPDDVLEGLEGEDSAHGYDFRLGELEERFHARLARWESEQKRDRERLETLREKLKDQLAKASRASGEASIWKRLTGKHSEAFRKEMKHTLTSALDEIERLLARKPRPLMKSRHADAPAEVEAGPLEHES